MTIQSRENTLLYVNYCIYTFLHLQVIESGFIFVQDLGSLNKVRIKSSPSHETCLELKPNVYYQLLNSNIVYFGNVECTLNTHQQQQQRGTPFPLLISHQFPHSQHSKALKCTTIHHQNTNSQAQTKNRKKSTLKALKFTTTTLSLL